jgi:L-histidine N-alpha-methyltransferase
VARDPARVRIEAMNLELGFEAGERIHTESAYKFAQDDVAKLAVAAGFKTAAAWTDRAHRFAVNLLVRG